MKKSDIYSGPWPRKRHSHTCVTCKSDRNQGAVACYKSKCKLPQRIESCECCRPLRPSVTHRPPAPAAEPQSNHLPACGFLKSGKDQTPCQCAQLRLAAHLEAEERERIGNTPSCEDCGKSGDNCICGEGCAVCGCEPCSCDDLEAEEPERGGVLVTREKFEQVLGRDRAPVQLSLFGGAL